ncbi:MAG TPA: FG-GAP-like repeat-containing protein, partial [Verrucomicrobiae bacterium]|nr:FG-GAP-like repeat-containing protein [Verrucomicrobiae bacterium]
RIAVHLKGNGANTRGIGARITLSSGAVPFQTQEMICGGRYLSSDESLRVFAAGTLTNNMQLEVRWPSGKRTVRKNVRANERYEIAEADATFAAEPKTEKFPPLFSDATSAIDHRHHENAFDDFARQALLPNRLSQLGPAVAWLDLDGDGREDLILGSGKEGQLAALHNDGSGKFSRIENSSLAQPVPRDTGGIVGFPSQSGGALLLTALATYEDALTNGAGLRLYHFPGGTMIDAFPAQSSSAGPLALGDMDGDGELELFVGGRVLAARYPEPATSLVMRSCEGAWRIDAASSAFSNIGLVSGAVWTDLNSDGFPELVLACEWGPLRIFLNEKGHLHDATEQFRLQKLKGWWNGVAAGDFDNDGRMDLIASNWGLNSKYRVVAGHGPRLYYGVWGGAGEIEPIEAVFDPQFKDWVPERDLNSVGRAIPLIRERFSTHRSFAEAALPKILGVNLKPSAILEVAWLETTVFLNRGDHFEPHPLPPTAQFSPAFGLSVADFDGDGNEDVFLSQNFFAVASHTSRNDAGRGLLLLGNGHGEFEPLDAAHSGIAIYGEQRGCAVADYDHDVRADLVVTQNGAATTLWHNDGAKPGLRVTLKGPKGNPAGIGAILRLGFLDRSWGPARELHAGSGYWSQDSAIAVLGIPTPPNQLEVRWPGGKKTMHAIPPGARDIVIDSAGGQLAP